MCGNDREARYLRAIAHFRAGGDELAYGYIDRFRAAERAGSRERFTLLSYVGYTGSDAALDFLLDRVRRGDELPIEDYRWAVRALSHTGRDEALDEALRLLDESTDKGVRTGAANALWRVSESRGELREDVLERVLELHCHPRSRRFAPWVLQRLEAAFGPLVSAGACAPDPR
jgi:hypothetical protein